MAASSSVKKLIDTAYIIESKGTHHHSIIWLHGFGDSADGCKDLFIQMPLTNTRIVLPNAPKQWTTIQGRQHYVQSWFEHDKTAVENHLKVLESVKELVDDELKLVDNASHIIIGGFRYFSSFFDHKNRPCLFLVKVLV
jgi:predicted esterase